MRRSHRKPATFNPSQLPGPVVKMPLGPQVVKSFGNGIRSISRLIHPEVSNPVRFGSQGVKVPLTYRPKRLKDVRSPVAPEDFTGVTVRSHLGAFDYMYAIS